MDNDDQQIMNDEYGREFGGCLWGIITCIIFVIVLCVIIACLKK